MEEKNFTKEDIIKIIQEILMTYQFPIRTAKKVSINGEVLHLENKSSTTSVCNVGDISVSGGKLYICTATNTWTVVGTQT